MSETSGHPPEVQPFPPRPKRFLLRLGRFLLWLPVYIVIAFALYVLSAGPMYWVIYEAFFMERGSLVAVLYSPLVWMSGWEPFGDWLHWYVGLWVL